MPLLQTVFMTQRLLAFSIQRKLKRNNLERDSAKVTPGRESGRVPWKLQLNVTVSSASRQGQLTEMRDAVLKILAEELLKKVDMIPIYFSTLRSASTDFASYTMGTQVQMGFVLTLVASSVLFE
jgi:hypothetical protein